MGEDQGNCILCFDWDLDDWTLANLNNDGDFETPTQTDLSAQASSIPVAASADTLGHPTVSFPFPDACEVSEPQYGPTACDHTDLNLSDLLESNEIASFAQIAQRPDLKGNEWFDTEGFIRLDSQGPTETASSLQLVPPPRSMEDETSPPVDFNWNSTIVPHTTFDPHILQNASSIQAPVSAKYGLFRPINLDPGPNMALSEMVPTSFEQPALPVDDTMIVPTAASESASSAMPFDGALFQSALLIRMLSHHHLAG